MMNAMTERSCTICGMQKEEGIHIVASFICSNCEHEMVSTDVRDEKYMFFVTRMKHIFLEKNA